MQRSRLFFFFFSFFLSPSWRIIQQKKIPENFPSTAASHRILIHLPSIAHTPSKIPAANMEAKEKQRKRKNKIKIKIKNCTITAGRFCVGQRKKGKEEGKNEKKIYFQ
ncbi:hypothetical protein DFH27DRAFT_65558 [Peziza echinospora]|nr:hypothetical protein DFH27DRAFT_65558 [Peziza echinospora]